MIQTGIQEFPSLYIIMVLFSRCRNQLKDSHNWDNANWEFILYLYNILYNYFLIYNKIKVEI